MFVYVCRNLGAQPFIPLYKKARTSFREMRLSLHLLDYTGAQAR